MNRTRRLKSARGGFTRRTRDAAAEERLDYYRECFGSGAPVSVRAVERRARDKMVVRRMRAEASLLVGHIHSTSGDYVRAMRAYAQAKRLWPPIRYDAAMSEADAILFAAIRKARQHLAATPANRVDPAVRDLYWSTRLQIELSAYDDQGLRRILRQIPKADLRASALLTDEVRRCRQLLRAWDEIWPGASRPHNGSRAEVRTRNAGKLGQKASDKRSKKTGPV